MANRVFNDYFITGAPTAVARLRSRFAAPFEELATPSDYSRQTGGVKLWLDHPAQGRLGMTIVTPRSSYGEVRTDNERETLNVVCASHDPGIPSASAWHAVGNHVLESRSWNDMPEGDFANAVHEMYDWVYKHFYRYVGIAVLRGTYPPEMPDHLGSVGEAGALPAA
jgi:hypothetical protein